MGTPRGEEPGLGRQVKGGNESWGHRGRVRRRENEDLEGRRQRLGSLERKRESLGEQEQQLRETWEGKCRAWGLPGILWTSNGSKEPDFSAHF